MASTSIAIAYDCLYPFTTGGGERQYRGFAEALVDEGRRVDYLTARQWDDQSPAATERFRVVPVTGRLNLHDADGVRRTPAALAFAWGLFRALVRRRRAYDAVIVSGLPVLNVFAARAALAGSGTKIVVDYLEVWGRRQWIEYAGRMTGGLAWMLQRLAIAVTPIATCHSQLTARRLRSEGLRSEPLVSPGLIDAGPATDRVSPAARPPYVVYAGRHIPDKRVESLPAAVESARKRVPDLRLVILGNGPSTPAVAQATHGRDWITMPGFVSEDRLHELMGEAACLVNPSRREGYGLVVVEASAYGTPVVLVADEGNAATELITADTNGFVASSADADDLADAIVRAVEGGLPLRARTREWYEDAVRTRTITRTVGNILTALDRAHPDSSRGTVDDRKETAA
ncbi:glycosyltransferase involved in cell wall biosynthesis [Microbacterium trichothecenolyticum]|uniref:glycosyltransferase family 4 protein n=1 Tax=Microbacterium trichothecenolyticum TaxID=69370 RepID=UPI00286275A6|nr:glycosyltransferase family 4 protein [Microbacterium trichothecenolyticum]MDR7185321.1 glycosyltransferase involved in cell wall biosynthesis [Microbacterium trichothecenolyticum]